MTFRPSWAQATVFWVSVAPLLGVRSRSVPTIARLAPTLVAAVVLFGYACAAPPSPGAGRSPESSVAALEQTDDGQAILALLRCEDFDCPDRLRDAVQRGAPVVPLIVELLDSAQLSTLGDVTLSRMRLLMALGELRDAGSVATIRPMTADSDPLVRGRAAEAIGKIAAESAVGDLTPLLDDPDSYVREAAAQALGRLDRPESRPALRAALEAETTPDVRTALAEAIRRSDG